MTPSSTHPHLRQYYGVDYPLARHPERRRLKRDQHHTTLHGHKIWGSALLMMEWLSREPLAPGSRVLEVGCGWGLLSTYCAKQLGCQVTASDADPAVLPYLDLLAELNGVRLAWQQAGFDDWGAAELRDVDVLIASDICFWDALAEPVWQLIQRAVDSDVPQILIADPLRPPFIEVAEACIGAYHAELLPLAIDHPRRHRGALLRIENR